MTVRRHYNKVVLPRLDLEWVHFFQCLHPSLRHGKGIMREIDLACGLIQFEHWKIDNPGKFETVWIDQP